MADIRSIYSFFHQSLHTQYNDYTDRPYAMFHSQTSQVIKTHITESFADPNGHVRILIATIAFGMGVDCQGLNTVFHFGPPSTVEDYFQETGRAGRNGKQSYAILLDYPGCTRSKSITIDMKLYLGNNTLCRRRLPLKTFGVSSHRAPKECCDICNNVLSEECFGLIDQAQCQDVAVESDSESDSESNLKCSLDESDSDEF